MSIWKKYKLGDVITLKRGYDLPQQDRQEGNIPVYSSSGLSGYHNVAMAKGPGVITGRYGTLGEVFYTEKDYWPHNTTLYIKDFKGNHPKFIYYFLQTLRLDNQNDKTSVPGLNRNHLHELEVVIPDFKTQLSIASFLSSFDDKIILNRQMNQTLEQMAQTLFKKYFIDDIDPDNLPNEWINVSLSDLMDFIGGSQPPAKEFTNEQQEGYTRLVQIRDFESDSYITYVPKSSKLRLCSKKDIMIARYGASVARVCFGLDGAYNVALVKVVPKKYYYTEFLRTYLKSAECQETIISMSSRSVQAGFNKDDFKSIQLAIPVKKELFEKYESVVTVFIDKTLQNKEENKLLARLRNTLLPKLMLGEIDVSAINQNKLLYEPVFS